MICLPGDQIEFPKQDLTLGPGFLDDPLAADPIPVVAGEVHRTDPEDKKTKNKNLVYIESDTRRYIPAVNDNVIGTVTTRHAEGYKVSVSDLSPGVQLNAMAFPNASKKNRVNLPNDALVYARVSSASREVEAEIECIDPQSGKAGGYGELKDGFCFDAPIAFTRQLLFKGHTVLDTIGELVPFEIAIGVNGKIWVKSEDVPTTLKIYQCIDKCREWPEDKVRENVEQIMSAP
ncbi:Exosome complex component RRP40 [Yarrowia sp. C11]|nr:Exosome complex component RRP40 [Yarrowia sp. C11]KAG5371175.1 Exosome complex component RRP40 [Yarrowia sp. E02]